jgi:hypothetical protein
MLSELRARGTTRNALLIRGAARPTAAAQRLPKHVRQRGDLQVEVPTRANAQERPPPPDPGWLLQHFPFHELPATLVSASGRGELLLQACG